jgi:O-antigen ligase
MKYLLAAFLTLQVFSGLLGLELSLAPGLSAKNLLIYAGVAVLLLRFVFSRDIRVEMPGVAISFGALAAYGVATWLLAAFVFNYDNYNFVSAGFSLKNRLIDYLFVFLVFLLGLRRDDAIWVLKYALLVFGVGHIFGIAHFAGLLDLEGLYNPYDTRLRGFVGEANQYGSMIACFLPISIAILTTARSVFEKLLWLAVICVSAIAFLLAGSRGALVGVVLGAGFGLIYFRSRLPMAKVFAGLAGALGIGLVILTLAGVIAGDYLYERFIGDSKAADINSVSSGRVGHWLFVLRLMADHPWTFLTGFGWDAFLAGAYKSLPHNTYLYYWYELGLLGVLVHIAWPWMLVDKFRAGVQGLTGDGPLLMGATVGIVAVAISAFFVELPGVWLYFWVMAGLASRVALDAQACRARGATAGIQANADTAPTAETRGDRFGWRIAKQG